MMAKKTRLFVFVGAAGAAIAAAVAIALLWPRGDRYPIPRTLRYSFTVHNPSQRVVKGAHFWTYAPVAQTSTQQVKNLTASHPFRLTKDELGNQRLHFVFDVLPPFASKVITVQATLGLSERPHSTREASTSAFLAAEPYIETDHPLVADRAHKLSGDKPSQTARNIAAWVGRHIEDSGYIQNDRGALYALEHKSGDCTESMYLYTALARANGIPARGVAGFVYADDAVLDPRDFHNWSQIYLDGAWVHVDPGRPEGGAHQADFIAMRILGGGNADQTLPSQGLAHGEKGLLVSLNR